MASPAQILANRENAQRSSGPRTTEGKQAASRNSTRHGLTGTQIVIPGEDASAYQEPLEGIRALTSRQMRPNAFLWSRSPPMRGGSCAHSESKPLFSPNLRRRRRSRRCRRPRFPREAQRTGANAPLRRRRAKRLYKAMAQLSKLQKERAIAEHESEESEIGFVSYRDPRVEVIASQPAPTNAPEDFEASQISTSVKSSKLGIRLPVNGVLIGIDAP